MRTRPVRSTVARRGVWGCHATGAVVPSGVGGAGVARPRVQRQRIHGAAWRRTSAGTETASPSDADAGGSGRDASRGPSGRSPRIRARARPARRRGERAARLPQRAISRARARRADEDLGIALDGRASVGRPASRDARAASSATESWTRAGVRTLRRARESPAARAMPERPRRARVNVRSFPVGARRAEAQHVHLEFLLVHTSVAHPRSILACTGTQFARSYSQNETRAHLSASPTAATAVAAADASRYLVNRRSDFSVTPREGVCASSEDVFPSFFPLFLARAPTPARARPSFARPSRACLLARRTPLESHLRASRKVFLGRDVAQVLLFVRALQPARCLREIFPGVIARGPMRSGVHRPFPAINRSYCSLITEPVFRSGWSGLPTAPITRSMCGDA